MKFMNFLDFFATMSFYQIFYERIRDEKITHSRYCGVFRSV